MHTLAQMVPESLSLVAGAQEPVWVVRTSFGTPVVILDDEYLADLTFCSCIGLTLGGGYSYVHL